MASTSDDLMFPTNCSVSQKFRTIYLVAWNLDFTANVYVHNHKLDDWGIFSRYLHFALSLAAQCIVIGPVSGGRAACVCVCVCGCVCVSVTTITQNCAH